MPAGTCTFHASALSTMSCTHFTTLARSCGFLLLYSTLSWKSPSPTWPSIEANIPKLSISVFDTSMMSGNLKMGLLHQSTEPLALPISVAARAESVFACQPKSIDYIFTLGEYKLATAIGLCDCFNDTHVILHTSLHITGFN